MTRPCPTLATSWLIPIRRIVTVSCLTVSFCSVQGVCFFFFFFQAEDGIRDVAVTGVQTCALPIWVPLLRHQHAGPAEAVGQRHVVELLAGPDLQVLGQLGLGNQQPGGRADHVEQDRKSTRLNSSHGYISYAVFCLKKKKKSITEGN